MIHTSDECASLAQAILQGTATAVSDGSYKSHPGTSAFLLCGNQRSLGALGSNIVPGQSIDHSSYQSKLAGISGSLAILSAVCDKYDILSGSVTIALDGEQALKKAASTWPLSPHNTDFDLLSDIRSKVKKLPISIKWEWIRGHQDDDIAFKDLSFLAQDNVIVDGVAKQRLNTLIMTGFTPHTQQFGDEGWSLHLHSAKLSKIDHDRLYEHFFEDDAKEYWSTKHDVSLAVIDSIDWDVCGEAIHRLTFAQTRRAIKHATGHFGVGNKMLQWKFQDHAACPRCQAYENPRHVILCGDARSEVKKDSSLSKLETALHKMNTKPALVRLITSAIRSWRAGTPVQTDDPSLRALVRSQNAIGWYPFLMGHVSLHWQGIQQAYYEWSGRQNTGRQWAIRLIIKLFDVSWDMWEHRNGILHGTITPAKQRAIDALDTSIQSEFTAGTSRLIVRDKRWFAKGINVILKYSIEEKEQWLSSVTLARARWRRQHEIAQASMETRRALLRNWLIPPPARPPEEE